MATLKQKLALKQIVDNHGNISAAMRQVGYKENTAKNPKNLTESQGFMELCEEFGLTDDLLTKALVQDIKAKKGNRVREIELGYKVRGRLKEQKDGNTTNNLVFIGEGQTARIARRAIARLARGQGTPDRLPDSDESEV